uniref:Uncharacterized protein n=1 Tax=Arundo donax TaxID=35708 RepID=A0A0A9C489_ARUDO
MQRRQSKIRKVQKAKVSLSSDCCSIISSHPGVGCRQHRSSPRMTGATHVVSLIGSD